MAKSSEKKSYSPWRMWGAYVGGAIGLLQALAVPINPVARNIFFFNWVFLVFLRMAIGFLIGWGIHSICRKLKN